MWCGGCCGIESLRVWRAVVRGIVELALGWISLHVWWLGVVWRVVARGMGVGIWLGNRGTERACEV